MLHSFQRTVWKCIGGSLKDPSYHKQHCSLCFQNNVFSVCCPVGETVSVSLPLPSGELTMCVYKTPAHTLLGLFCLYPLSPKPISPKKIHIRSWGGPLVDSGVCHKLFGVDSLACVFLFCILPYNTATLTDGYTFFTMVVQIALPVGLICDDAKYRYLKRVHI